MRVFKKATPNNPLTTLEYIRQQRDRILLDCDWTQGNDSPLSNAKKTEWATYRQQLRDLPASYSNSDAIADVVFPNEPS
tara:strand:- start:127 stop:363 length:237 start_codon:yes stop_codon:yes gene_type:complete